MSQGRILAVPWLCIFGLATLIIGGCTPSEERVEEDENSIQQTLDEYLPRLAEAYSLGDLAALKVYAAEYPIFDSAMLDLLARHGGAEANTLRERLDGVLTGYAAEKEIAVMEKRIEDLLTESRVIRPTPLSVQLEDVRIFNYANAFVTSLETWDLRVYAAGTDKVLSEALGQRNRVKYQMKRRDDGWVILYRVLETTFE